MDFCRLTLYVSGFKLINMQTFLLEHFAELVHLTATCSSAVKR